MSRVCVDTNLWTCWGKSTYEAGQARRPGLCLRTVSEQLTTGHLGTEEGNLPPTFESEMGSCFPPHSKKGSTDHKGGQDDRNMNASPTPAAIHRRLWKGYSFFSGPLAWLADPESWLLCLCIILPLDSVAERGPQARWKKTDCKMHNTHTHTHKYMQWNLSPGNVATKIKMFLASELVMLLLGIDSKEITRVKEKY